MVEFLSPFVFWGQNKENISLRVDLRDVKNETVQISEDGVVFEATAVGVQGNNKYRFDVDFYLPVDPEESTYKVTEKFVEFQLKKVGGEIWPRLTEKQIKLPWLKIDFDKFQLEDDSDDDDENKYNNYEASMMDQIEKTLTTDNKSKSFDFKLSYTLLYNLFQFVGFLYIFVRLQYQYYQYGEEAKIRAFEDVGSHIIICQFVAMLEIIHPMLGIVKTGWIAPLAQVYGRNVAVFILILNETQLQIAPATWYLFVVWSMVEIVRYPYYIFSSMNIEFPILTWLRYSLWIPLYPLGFLLEGTVIIMSIPLFEINNKFSIMYDSDRYIIFFPWYLHIHLMGLAVASYKLMNYMYIQRKQKLGTRNKSKASLKQKTS